MPQSAFPATLPALIANGGPRKSSIDWSTDKSIAVSTTTQTLPSTSGARLDSSSSTRTAAVVPSMDYAALYTHYCAEEERKANSAVLRLLRDRGGRFSLERLHLGNNYLGPKGLRPVLRLLDQCQTVVSLNLEGNGVDNAAVSDLCAVLERHLGVTAVNLRQNPISIAGGRQLLQLAESSTRLTEIALEGTDVLEGMQERIRMALQRNATALCGSRPQMAVLNEILDSNDCTPRSEHTASSSSAAAAPAQHYFPAPQATLQVTHRPSRVLPPLTASSPASSTAGAAVALPSSTFAAPPRAEQQHYRGSSTTTGVWREAALSASPPRRPPPPAVAPVGSKALPVDQVKDLKALFAERARLHTEIGHGEASKQAYAARAELQAMERTRHTATESVTAAATLPLVKVGSDRATSQTYPGAASTDNSASRPPVGSDDKGTRCSDSRAAQQKQQGEVDGQERSGRVNAECRITALHSGEEDIATYRPAPSLDRANASSTTPAPGALVVPVVTSPLPQAHTVEDVLNPARMMLLTNEEQFTVLFDQGCREYMNRNLDAAYMVWNEAMRLAVSEGKREWIAVVASNLQRLSYELLVEEGAGQLERGDIEKAGETFKLALEVAVKAKNAEWERDMRLAQQNVLKTLFLRCHEAALLLFQRARQEASQDEEEEDKESRSGSRPMVKEEDYFVLQGSGEMVRHTPAFVREWGTLLLLKEAVGLWAEGVRVVARLGDATAAPLRLDIVTALNQVAGFFVRTHMSFAAPAGLLWLHTENYLYHECVLLSEVWYGLVADCEQSLRHPLLSSICALQLGELYVATHQLPQALVQLQKVVQYGQQYKDLMLHALGLTLCGRVHLLRANHALAESALISALELWTDVRCMASSSSLLVNATARKSSDTASPDAFAVTLIDTNTFTASMRMSNPANKAESAPVGQTARLGGRRGVSDSVFGKVRYKIEEHLPSDAVSVMANACRQLHVCLLLRTYRYRDALESLEGGLNTAYDDTLQSKLSHNYTLSPSVEEMAAFAGQLHTCLVFYTITTRYSWAVETNMYEAADSLSIWVLAATQEMRYVEVNLAKDFKCSLRSLLEDLQQRLCVTNTLTTQPAIITALPSRDWQDPLRVLYEVCIHPIINYVRAADPLMPQGDGVMTIVPTGLLWLVPFHALLNVKAGDRYLVEEAAVQLAFSATQAAYSVLNAGRVRREHVKHTHPDLVVMQSDTEETKGTSRHNDKEGGGTVVLRGGFCTTFPPNADRSSQEGSAVVQLLKATQIHHLTSPDSPTEDVTSQKTGLFAGRVDVVEDVATLRSKLPRAHTAHITTPITAPVRGKGMDEHNEAGLILSAFAPPSSASLALHKSSVHPTALDILSATEVGRMELVASHVALTNTNLSAAHVRGTDDHLLKLLRSFFASGVPCVMAGQWCTPEMQPLVLFKAFYKLWSGVTVDPSVASSEAVRDGVGEALARAVVPVSSSGMAPHRARVLARAIRELLKSDSEVRYQPRLWAGYYCIGTGE